MCDWGTTIKVRVKVPARLSYTKHDRWKMTEIDSCIAGLVELLQDGGINMESSCCGRGKNGCIDLCDGHRLIVVPNDCSVAEMGRSRGKSEDTGRL